MPTALAVDFPRARAISETATQADNAGFQTLRNEVFIFVLFDEIAITMSSLVLHAASFSRAKTADG